MEDDIKDYIEDETPKKNRAIKIKQRLLKKDHTHKGTSYPVGTPLENLKASDSTIEFLEERDIV